MSVLLTGATGFVGRVTARRLLDAGHDLIALVRPRPGQSGRSRVGAALGPGAEDDRLMVVEGDLVQGIEGAGLERLRASVDTVIHCAGDTTFSPADLDRFWAGHVHGPRALLVALASGRLRRWVQVSTAFVCGRREGLVREDEDDVGQSFHNPYERVKLEAECVLRAEGARRGLEVSVVRPSIVVGPAPGTAGAAPANLLLAFVRLVAGLARLAPPDLMLRIAARPRARFNIVPVDDVAAAIVALARHPGPAGSVVHLVAEAPSQAATLAMIAAHFGVRGLCLVDASEHDLADASSLERRVARMLAPYRDYLTQDVRFDDHRARALLDACRVPRPVLDEAALERLIGLAVGTTGAAAGRKPAPAGARA
jgi:nucleoside-diphosphate-sugar epimerase